MKTIVLTEKEVKALKYHLKLDLGYGYGGTFVHSVSNKIDYSDEAVKKENPDMQLMRTIIQKLSN